MSWHRTRTSATSLAKVLRAQPWLAAAVAVSLALPLTVVATEGSPASAAGPTTQDPIPGVSPSAPATPRLSGRPEGLDRPGNGDRSVDTEPDGRVDEGPPANHDQGPRVKAAQVDAEKPAAASNPSVNLRPAALALAAARPGRAIRMNEKSVIRVARTLGLDVTAPLAQSDVQRIARRAWKRARHEMTLAGVPYGVDGPDRGDFERAARELGVRTKPTLHPSDVRRVLLAGRSHLLRHFRKGHVDTGRMVGLKNLRQAARRFDVGYGEKLYPADANRIAHVVDRKGSARWEARNRTPVFARTGGVALRMPSHDVRYAGFHQASGNVKRLNPKGKATTRVLPSRARGTSRTSAIDIVMRPGDDVRAPVTGRVVEVRGYRLYGKYSDYRMRIVPSDNPQLLVTVLHVKSPKVRVGQKVSAGKTVMAGSVRKFPFYSQVDGFSGKPWGHVHIEARRR